jgi:hypothetical protein
MPMMISVCSLEQAVVLELRTVTSYALMLLRVLVCINVLLALSLLWITIAHLILVMIESGRECKQSDRLSVGRFGM